MARPFLSVVIPTHNSAGVLPLTLLDVDRFLAAQEYSYEILVVDDGSGDATVAVTSAFADCIKHLKLIENVGSRGVGSAVKIGVLAASGQWRVVLDPFNTVSVADFTRAGQLLFGSAKTDVLVGSRALTDTRLEDSLSLPLRVLEAMLNAVARRALRLPVRDVLMGFYCFSRSAADEIFSPLATTTAAYPLEALVRAAHLGRTVREVPVHARRTRASRTRSYYLQMVRGIATLWWRFRVRVTGNR